MTGAIKELSNTSEMEKRALEVKELIRFMTGTYSETFAQMICYFSEGGKYLYPAELKIFWESLSQSQKTYYELAMWNIYRKRGAKI